MILAAFLYLSSLFAMRATIFFTTFGYRLLFPFTCLILFGLVLKLISRLKNSNNNSENKFMTIFIFIILFSFSLNVIYKQINYENNNYFYEKNRILLKYKDVKPGTAIVFGERQLDYLRIDLIPIKPFYKPLFSKVENKEDFLNRVSKFQSIYFNSIEYCTKPYKKTISQDRPINCISTIGKYHHFDLELVKYINDKRN